MASGAPIQSFRPLAKKGTNRTARSSVRLLTGDGGGSNADETRAHDGRRSHRLH
jgi:hypothetical protein